MCGMVLTKREGLLLAALLLVAAALARLGRATGAPSGRASALRRHRRSRRSLRRGGSGTSPAVSRARAAGRLSIRREHGATLAVAPARVRRALLERLLERRSFRSRSARSCSPLLARAYALAVFFGALVALVTLGGGWITWAIPELPITQELGGNPIVRYMGAAALLCVAASPLLLAAAWRRVTTGRRTSTPMSSATLVGRRDRRRSTRRLPARRLSPSGAPRFPTRDECVRACRSKAQPVDVVFGRFDDPRVGGRASRSRRRGRLRRHRGASATGAGAGRSSSKMSRASRSHARSRRRPRPSTSHRRSSSDPAAERIPSLAMSLRARRDFRVRVARARARPAGARRPLPADDPHRHVPQAAVGARRLADAL